MKAAAALPRLGLLVAALALGACGGGGGSSGSGSGTLQLSLTDAPACGFDAVNVTITGLSVNQSATAGASDAGWVNVPITAQRINLLDWQNGLLTTLGTTPLAAGHYTQMRLQLAKNSGNTLANSVVPSGGQETALDTPSAVQSGLKLNVDLTVAANQIADFVLDFNACRSVVTAGASGKYLLKPVIAVTPNFISGVSGKVAAAIEGGTAAGTQILLETPGSSGTAPIVVKATAPDSTGSFLLEPVAPGTYDLVVSSAGHAAAVVTSVVVQSQLVTSIATTLDPPLSATSAVQPGTVSSAVTPIDATISAQQTLSGGAVLEMASAGADSSTGAFSFTLPLAAPVVAAYVPGSLAFSADSTAAAKYTFVASSGGVNQSAGPLQLVAGSNAALAFAF
ncbi:MAG: DUF4382 domain-containing protein [Burkholderiales bacterium]|nr:DUF4382 domain-containing protein [Burkholderiales bacterium]MDE2455118.1 DUF4382 domain-containing protein [Burkholderiales bacterium]